MSARGLAKFKEQSSERHYCRPCSENLRKYGTCVDRSCSVQACQCECKDKYWQAKEATNAGLRVTGSGEISIPSAHDSAVDKLAKELGVVFEAPKSPGRSTYLTIMTDQHIKLGKMCPGQWMRVKTFDKPTTASNAAAQLRKRDDLKEFKFKPEKFLAGSALFARYDGVSPKL